MTPVLGGLLGGLFFIWIAGLRVIAPGEYGWVMQLDWQVHFLGWHFFRDEPWHWPPGRIAGYFHAPDGTAIGFTDSIPLAAFLLKPFARWLPDPFQYLGPWLLVCYVLQGVFGVLIARVWTSRPALQLLAAMLFVLMPTLLVRVGHPSLCAHFLLLACLWLYFRSERPRPLTHAQGVLGLTAGLVHPYLAVMVLGLLTAVAVRARLVGGWLAALAGVVTGWWASGLFTASGAEQLATEGLGHYSMNLLAPITPSGWSTLLPEWPVASHGQTYEGFQYFGAGVLLLMVVAAVVAAHRPPAGFTRRFAPLLVVVLASAVYALSPRVTVGGNVLFDVTSPTLERLAVFRATGRFFWPLAYVTLAAAIAALVTRVRPRHAAGVLALAVLVQVVDLRDAHAERRAASRSDALHGQGLPLTSPLWAAALPHYTHMVLVNPEQCGEAPTTYGWPAYLAGLYDLTINAGVVARPDVEKLRAYCRSLEERTRAGVVADDTIYLVHPRFVAPLQQQAQSPVVCLEADGIPVCVTERSYAAWGAALPEAAARE